MRSGARAAIGIVAKGMDMHATLGVGVIASDVVGDGCWSSLRVLFKLDGARDFGVTTEDSN